MKSEPLPGWEIPREFWSWSFFAGQGGTVPAFLESNPARIWFLKTDPPSLVSAIVMPGQVGWICFLGSDFDSGTFQKTDMDTVDFWRSCEDWLRAQGCLGAQFLSERINPHIQETSGERLRIPDWFAPICDFWDLEWTGFSLRSQPVRPSTPWLIRKNALALEETELAMATMEGSLDCPELARMRSHAAAWESLLQVHGRERECRVLEVGGQPAGILLAFPPGAENYPQFRDGLVAYLGLIPSVRGQGWGRVLLGDFLEECTKGSQKPPTTSVSSPRIATMVDSRNRPAMALYEKVGFQKKTRGKFHLATLQPVFKQ